MIRDDFLHVGEVFVSPTLDARYRPGEWVVVRVGMQAGNWCVGNAGPDGWHVTARLLARDGKYDHFGPEIDFYQSGPRRAEFPVDDIRKVRTMTMIFV